VGRFDLGGATRIFHSENIIQVNAVISGTGGVILTGPQDVIFYGANTYSGQTLIENGELALGLGGTPGSTASGTTVQAGGAIRVHDVNIGNESLTLHGGAPRSMVYLGTNTWNGPVSVINECVIVNDKSNSINDLPDLTFAGAITGTGALRKQGIGTLRFSGAVGNTYSGGFYCQEGTAYFNKSSSAPALSGPLVIGGPSALTTASVIIQKINQIPNPVPISLLEHGTLRTENSATDSLGPIEFTGGALFGASGSFTLSGDVTNHFTSFGPGGIYGNVSVSGARIFHCDDGSVLNVQSALGGVGGVLKMGPGEMTLAGPCTYSQGSIVEEGILHVQGNGRPGDGSAATSVVSGALLHLEGVNLTNQNFYLEGGAANNAPALLYSDTNYLTGGSVEIHKAVTFKADPAAKLTVDTAITGSEGLRHEGDGTLALSGAQPNTYSGATLFGEGRLLLAHNNNASIPHSLVVGYETNGSPSAVVQCSAPNQFALLGGSELGLGGVTLNAGTSLDCGGYNQSIANLNLTDASVATGGGHLALMGNLLVQPAASGQSFLSGAIQLNTGINNTHLFSVASNVVVFSSANFTESGTQNIYKDGAGQFGSLGSMVFSGTLTVHNGRWLAANANPFGTPAAPTIVDAGATLVAFAGTFSEPLQLAGDGDNGAGALYTTSTNSFDGSVVLTDDTTITADSSAILELKGAVSGPGKLTKEGTGTLLLSGPAANTYAGGTLVSQGVLELGKSGAVAVPGDLTCPGNSGNNGVRLLAPDQIADSAAVALQGSAFFNLNDNNETIGSLSGSGPVALGSGTLTAGANGKDTSFSGGMGGTGGLTKTGTGTMTLLGNKLPGSKSRARSPSTTARSWAGPGALAILRISTASSRPERFPAS
jgi:autotransporter-associated beta strand protein